MLYGEGPIANRFAKFQSSQRYIIYIAPIDKELLVSQEEMKFKEILSNANSNQTIVYISAFQTIQELSEPNLCIHPKLNVEKILLDSGHDYVIMKLPELFFLDTTDIGLVKPLMLGLKNNKSINLTDECANLIDIDDAYEIVNFLLKENLAVNKVVNIACPFNTSLVTLANDISTLFKNGLNFIGPIKNIKDSILTEEVSSAIKTLGINFDQNYNSRALKKYYSNFFNKKPTLSIIIPTYNQSLGINEFYRRLKLVLNMLSERFDHEMIFINDFSLDETLTRLVDMANFDQAVKIINFSRNFGNQAAIAAGIEYCSGDVAVIIDDDLQDPPEIILDFIAKWHEGYRVVYGIRSQRPNISPIFKILAKIYYRILGVLSETKIPNDVGDFRLIDKIVIENLRLFPEENLYYRGMVAWVGYKQIGLTYERDQRYAGKSNFSYKKYINFAINGLTSFTDRPLFFSGAIGLFISVGAFFLAVALIATRIINPHATIEGWTSLAVIILFFGGVQLFSVGILGVYISKIYRQVKNRPIFLIDEKINF